MSSCARVCAYGSHYMSNKKSLCLTLGALLCAYGSLATAAAPGIVVTATRLDLSMDNTPGHVTVIERETIAQSPARTLPDLLALEAGIFSRSLFGNQAANSKLDVRGFGAASAENVLILLDGRRLNDIDQSAVDFSAIPLKQIERIEILRNGGAVLYGDGAVGGAINIVTREALAIEPEGQVELKLGSHASREINADYLAGFGPASLRLSAQAINSDGYRANNELQQRNAQADLRVTGDDFQWYAKAGADDLEQRLPGPRSVNPGLGIDELSSDRRGTSEPNNYANRDGRHLTLGLSRVAADGSETILDLGWRSKHQASFFDYGGGFSDYLEANLDTWSFTPRLNTRIGAVHSTLGMDYYHSEYDTEQSLNPNTRATPFGVVDITQKTAALYSQNHLILGTGTRVDFGARLQWIRFNGDDRVDDSAPGSSGATVAPAFDRSDRVHMLELGLRQPWRENLSLFAKASRGARLATVDELFESKFDFGTFTTARVFSPLEPQTSTGLDLGLDYARDTTSATLALYYMELKNEIHFDVASFDNINLDPTRRHGLELTAEHAFSSAFRLRGNYAYVRARFRDGPYDGNDLPLVPRHSASLSGIWTLQPATRLAATLRYEGEKRFDNDQSNDFGRKIPAYSLVDVKLSHEYQEWMAALTVHNLFDREVYDYGVRSTFSPGVYNAYPLPERSFTLSLARSF